MKKQVHLKMSQKLRCRANTDMKDNHQATAAAGPHCKVPAIRPCCLTAVFEQISAKRAKSVIDMDKTT
jgi:hypothetical protein